MKLKLFLGLLMICMVSVLIAQNPIDVIDTVKNAKTFTELIGYDGLILTALITISGYLSPYIPGIKKIPNTTFRVLTFAILIIVGGTMFGWVSIWKGIISYFFSTSVYEIVLKWFVKTKEPT